MSPGISLAVLGLSALLFGVVSGAHAALEALSYRPPEKDEEEDEEPRFLERLARDPVYYYLSLGTGRLFLVGLVVVASSRLAASRLVEGGLAGPALWVFIIMVLIVPLWAGRIVALKNPEVYLERARFVIYPVVYLMWPIASAAAAVLKRVSPGALEAVAFSIIPFKRRIELFGPRNGGDETEEHQLVSSVFDFGDTKVREVMVPRIDMVAVNLHAPQSEAVEVVVEAGHSRVPVYDDSIDRIVGILHAKDVLARIVAGGEFTVEDLMRDVYFVPESKKIGDLLSEFRKRRIHIAIAVDEYGGTAGLVTMENVLEELVGDIQDEFDVEEERVRAVDADTAVCSAKTRLDEIEEIFGIDLGDGDADTLGGFLYESIGRVPRVGELIASRGLEFRVESVVGQRIDKVRVKGLASVRKRPEGAEN